MHRHFPIPLVPALAQTFTDGDDLQAPSLSPVQDPGGQRLDGALLNIMVQCNQAYVSAGVLVSLELCIGGDAGGVAGVEVPDVNAGVAQAASGIDNLLWQEEIVWIRMFRTRWATGNAERTYVLIVRTVGGTHVGRFRAKNFGKGGIDTDYFGFELGLGKGYQIGMGPSVGTDLFGMNQSVINMQADFAVAVKTQVPDVLDCKRYGEDLKDPRVSVTSMLAFQRVYNTIPARL